MSTNGKALSKIRARASVGKARLQAQILLALPKVTDRIACRDPESLARTFTSDVMHAVLSGHLHQFLAVKCHPLLQMLSSLVSYFFGG